MHYRVCDSHPGQSRDMAYTSRAYSLGKVKKWGSVEEMDVKVEQGERMYTGNSQLGELVLKWLQEDLTERGPRNGKGEGATYQSLEGKGGYGAEKRVEDK